MFVHAYVDESYDLTIGVYILTASIVDYSDAEDIRCMLRELRRGGGKLHWSKEPTNRRDEIVKTVSTLSLTTVSVIGSSAALRPERSRRKCMEVLLPELESAGVDAVHFEARQERNNKQDKELIATCRMKRILSNRIQIDFVPGGTEPLLWLPDITCGILLATERGDDSYFEQLGHAARQLKIAAN
ncbi:hypothetical protein AB0L13_10610 [Saccharopolyspora shandongensis]|uniref:hypothetical protein n=1 Tax=Saccharopolyspora shandongensis TaxID=418495 RepID=UPI00342AC77D